MHTTLIGGKIKMKAHKAQIQAVSYVLVLGVILATVSATYFWGLPLLQKGEATSKLESAKASAMEIQKTLNEVIKTGGQKSITITSYGMIIIKPDENAIDYIIRSKKSPYATNIWIPLGSEVPHGVKGTPWENSTAFLGHDQPAVVMVKVEPAQGEYIIIYRVALRKLYDLDTGDAYYYNLTAGGNTMAMPGNVILTLSAGSATRTGKPSVLGGEVINIPVYASIGSAE